MQEQLVAFATALSSGDSNPSKGAHFVSIMGDGGPAFLRGVNEALKRIGPEGIRPRSSLPGWLSRAAKTN